MSNPLVSHIRSLNDATVDYEIADLVARAGIANIGNFIIAWKGDSTPDVSAIPAGVVVTYNGVDYTGTKQPSADYTKNMYLVQRGTTNDSKFEEFVVVTYEDTDPVTYSWESLGYTTVSLEDLGQLAYMDTVTLAKGDGDMVLGASTTFTATAPTITPSVTKKGLAISQTQTAAVNVDTTQQVVTGLGTADTDTAIKELSTTSVPLARTSIRGVNGTETVSKVTTTSLKMAQVSVPNVTSVGTLPSLSMTVGGDNGTTLILGFSTGTTPTLGTAISVADGTLSASGTGDDVSGCISVSNYDVAKAATDVTTVATGLTDANGTGASVITSVSTKTSINAVTGYSDPDTANVPATISVSRQPAFEITDTAAGQGDTDVPNTITATATAPAVTANADDNVKVAVYDALSVTASATDVIDDSEY